MPYWRLSNYYFFYFAALGALVPYWGLYLKSLAFDAVEIGQLMAILMATKVVAPNVWGWLGDHLGKRMLIVRLASLVSVIVFVGMFWADSYWSIALIMVLFSFFWNASLPQFEVVTFRYLEDRVAQYSRIRVWGSVGFILTVLALGVLVDQQGPAVVLSAVFLIYLGIWLSTLVVSEPGTERHPPEQASIWGVLKRPAIVAFFIAVFLMQVGHGPYYTFYSIYMEQQGLSKTVIGQLWALGVFAEVVLYIWFMHTVLERWGGRLVLAASLALAALRWVLIGLFPDSMAMLLVAQILHAATFGSFHAAAIHLVHHYFQGRHSGRGQALYSSLSFGAGGAVGALASGFTWEYFGPVESFLAAGAASALGALIVWWWIDESHDY